MIRLIKFPALIAIIAGGLWASACLGFELRSPAGRPAPDSRRETSLSQAEQQRQAVNRIPLKTLDPHWRTRVLDVVSRTAMFRGMSSQIIECEPEFYRFLVEHPEVVVGMWQTLGVTKLKLEVVEKGRYRFDDGAGTLANVQYLYSSPTVHVVYGEGSYTGPLMLRPVEGRAVVVLTSNYLREAGGNPYVSARLDLFVQVDRAGVELLAKALHPLLGSMAETNYEQTIAFLGSVYRTAVVRPESLRRMASQLPKVDAETRKDFADWITRLASSSDWVADRAAMADPPSPLHEQALQPEGSRR